MKDIEVEEERPHWVRTLDHSLTHTSHPDEWNRDVIGSSHNPNTANGGIYNTNGNSTTTSHKSKHFKDKDKRQSPKQAKKSKNGDHHASGKSYNAMLYRGNYSDTTSLASRITTSSERRERKRSRRLGLFLVLLILAFIVAALLGWLTYWLLMRDSGRVRHGLDHDKGKTLVVDSTMRILNETYTPQMADKNSADFKRIAEPICQEMDSFFLASNLSDVYNGCQVNEIRNVANEAGCQCAWTSDGSLLVDFSLRFNGTLNKDTMRWNVYDIIERGTTKHHINSLVFMYIRNFLVDIGTNWSGNYDGVEAEITIPVFNLNYSYFLENTNSKEFQDIARPFCDDVGKILTNQAISAFYDRYAHCRVTDFSPRPDRIKFLVYLRGREWRSIQKTLIYTLMEGARDAIVQSQTVKMIGPLIVTPYNIDFWINPTIIPETTTTSTTTTTPKTTTPSPDLTYVYNVFRTWNLTLTPVLQSPSSPEFVAITNEFCKDLERLYDLSIYGYRFYNCTVHAFRNDPTSIVVSVGYLGGPWPGMDHSVEWVIRRHAPAYYYDMKEVYLVGSIYLILGEIIANGLELRTNLRVMNLTYTPDLSDHRTVAFQYHAFLFCQDMRRFYMKSEYAHRFFECGVDHFTDDPVRIHFYLVFYDTDLNGLEASIVNVIRRYAQPMYFQIYLCYLVGDLLVLPEEIETTPSVYPTNITVTPTDTMTMTTTEEITTTSIESSSETWDNYGVQLTLYYECYNLSFTQALLNPMSQEFLRHKHAVCDDLWRWYMGSDSPFQSVYRNCDVTSFRENPDGVTFTMLFETKYHTSFTRAVREFLQYKAPKVYIPGYNLLDVGYLLLIMDRYAISWTLTSITATTLQTPPITTIPISSTDFIPTTTIDPTTSALVTSTVVPPPESMVSYEFGLADFIFTPDLYNKTSFRFKYHLERFCKDIDRYYQQSGLEPFYESCVIDGFAQRPNEDYPDKVFFTFKFNTPMFYELQQQITGVLFSTPPRVPRGGFITLHIGDLFLIIDPYTTESPPTDTSGDYISPTITIVTTTEDIIATPTTPEPSTSPETTPTTPTTPTTTTTASTTTPEPTYFIKMSFQTMNLTWTPELNDTESSYFKSIEKLFCADIDETLYSHINMFPSYMKCKIETFSRDPMRVNFSLQFKDLEGVNRSSVPEDVVGIIIENAPREDYMGLFSVLVGNLLISMDGITVSFSTVPTTPSIFDAIAYNYTFYLYPGDYSEELLDRNSMAFKERAYLFCKDVDDIFENIGLRNVKKRYFGCVVDEFGPNQEIKFRVILTDTKYVLASTMFSIFAYHGEAEFFDGISYFPIGGIYVTFDADPAYSYLKLELFTTHPYPYTTTTPTILYTSRTISLNIVEPEWSSDLSIVSSSRYRLLAESFCDDVTSWLKRWGKVNIVSCGAVKFTEQPYQITFELTFTGTLDQKTEFNMFTVIMEDANKFYLGGVRVSEIGRLLIQYSSLAAAQLAVYGPYTGPTTPRTTPATTRTTTSTTPQPVNPCENAGFGQVVPHPTRCDGFYQCFAGNAIFIECSPGWVYEQGTCGPQPPGFVCNK